MTRAGRAPRLVLAGALALAAACSRQPPAPGPDVVARLAGDDVRYADFEGYLRGNVGESAGALASEALSNLFDRFLTEAALTRLAVERRRRPRPERSRAPRSRRCSRPSATTSGAGGRRSPPGTPRTGRSSPAGAGASCARS